MAITVASFEVVTIQQLPPTGQGSGIDLGIEAFATLFDGTHIFHPGRYRKIERALKTAQRRVPRRKKGSDRRCKAVKLLAKTHLRMKPQRHDFHHKTALALVRENETIHHEGLQVRNLLTLHTGESPMDSQETHMASHHVHS
jgi:putative transposase